jgi:hypothetical protein
VNYFYTAQLYKKCFVTSVFAAFGRKLLAPAEAVMTAKYFHLLLKPIDSVFLNLLHVFFMAARIQFVVSLLKIIALL